jgi:hypothetical protein
LGLGKRAADCRGRRISADDDDDLTFACQKEFLPIPTLQRSQASLHSYRLTETPNL